VEKAKAKINAKKFVDDFRSGKSDEELMKLHGLDLQALDKVFRILVQKKFLSQSDLLEGHSFRATRPEEIEPAEHQHRAPEPQSEFPGPWGDIRKDESSKCPQCGAAVSPKKLTCPECGHVLRGEERWADVGAKPGFFDRMPPKLLGLLIALPVGLVLLYLFRDILMPMAEKTMQKRQDSLAKEWTYGQSPIEMARQMKRQQNRQVVQSALERLIAEEVLLSSDAVYTTFVAGPRWHQLAEPERERYLNEIRTAMIEARMDVRFTVVDLGRQALARVSESSVEFGPFTEEAPESEIGKVPQEMQGGSAQKAFRETVERRLPFLRPPGTH
jgi:hypothetical protein